MATTRRGLALGTAMGATSRRREMIPRTRRKTCSGRAQSDLDHPDQKRSVLTSQTPTPRAATSIRRTTDVPPPPASAASSRDPIQGVLVPARRLALDEDAMPDRDLHESPDGPARIAARLLLTQQRGDAAGTEPALDSRIPWQYRGQLVE